MSNVEYERHPYPQGLNRPPAPKKKRHAWLWMLAVIAGLCAFGSIIAAVSNASGHITKASPSKAPAIAKAVAPPTEASAEPATANAPGDSDGDGTIDQAFSTGGVTFLVPGDYDVAKKFNGTTGQIKPGTYTVATDGPDGHCYWERVKDWDGGLDSIIANDNIEGTAKAKVTVKKSDAGLHLGDGCMAAIKAS